MKRFSTITILSMLAAVFLAACSNRKSNREQEPAGKEEQMVMTADTVIPAAGILLKDDRLNAVYMQYAELTRALINDDVKTARLSANAVAAGAAEMTGAAAVAAAAAKITATADIEAQRTAYAALSNEIISLIKKSGMNRGALYIDFCPMAMNDKGAFWLSDDKTIQNPYFGESMKTCGEVKETIK